MKKTIIIAAICMAALPAFSQGVHWGIKAGLNVSDISSNGPDVLSSRLGFHGGGLAHIHISPHFAVQPELLYSNQGAEIDDSDEKYKLAYLNMPVMAQYMFNNGFRIQTGPQIGLLLKGTRDDGDNEVDIKDNLETIDFAWSFGVGYIFKSRIGIDARYNLGLIDIAENPAVDYKNRVFQVGLFYQFRHR